MPPWGALPLRRGSSSPRNRPPAGPHAGQGMGPAAAPPRQLGTGEGWGSTAAPRPVCPAMPRPRLAISLPSWIFCMRGGKGFGDYNPAPMPTCAPQN